MKNLHLLIGTPAYGGQLTVEYTSSLLNTKKVLESKGIVVGTGFISNESLVQRARNTIVAKFMSIPSFTHLLFIDADITWCPDDIINLLGNDKDLVGGIYPKKKYNWNKLPSLIPRLQNKIDKDTDNSGTMTDFTRNWLESKLLDYTVNYVPQTQIDIVNQKYLVEVKHVGTGFMLISRRVIEKMIDNYQWTKYDDDHDILTSEENKWLYSLFDCDISDCHFLSEDYLFCKRWTDVGEKVYADLRVGLSHSGHHKFQGHFGLSFLE